MADYPQMLAEGRRAALHRLWRAAGYGALPGDGGREYDDEGRLILRGSGALRSWLGAWGVAA